MRGKALVLRVEHIHSRRMSAHADQKHLYTVGVFVGGVGLINFGAIEEILRRTCTHKKKGLWRDAHCASNLGRLGPDDVSGLVGVRLSDRVWSGWLHLLVGYVRH